MLPSAWTVTDQHGGIELPKTAALASRSLNHIPGPTRIDTALHGGFTVHLPDRAGYDLC
ncbi:hypothetical protein DPMN_106941 [Dreissena polymorpha]|uniref:Uncharacterized protein n=1 Tax=Dreissena polymorpha TaxID=45954 RepID=A0A9D4K653_DREPO|nr:hypothetical protein DPMN_106941 [Dreissena polymorpha]